ncbi:MAG: tetratricopeptide repeat protein [Desulfovibrionaceae bacterium]|nr:tetratricopeptide repeat protein [Desulfovibrionaceae bacterium]
MRNFLSSLKLALSEPLFLLFSFLTTGIRPKLAQAQAFFSLNTSRLFCKNFTPHLPAFSQRFLRVSALTLLLVTLLAPTACVGGKSEGKKQEQKQEQKEEQEEVKSTDQTTLAQSESEPDDVLPLASLTPEAKSVYAFLLCDQAFRNEDEAALFEAVPIMQELKVSPQMWMEAGFWLVSRKSEHAEFFLKLARETWPEDSSLLMLYAEALKGQNKLDDAIALLRTFLKTHPKASDVKLELAILLVQNKKFTEADDILKSITKEERNPLVDVNQGKALVGMQRYDEALVYLKRAAKGMPDLPDAHIELGLVYERLGQINNALKAYENVLKTDFPAKNILLRLINLSLQINQPEKALSYMEAGPSDIPFKLICADMFIDSKHYLQAANILKPIVERNDAPVEVYMLLADLTWEHLRDLNGALAWLDKMPESYQKSSNALLLRTHLLAKAAKKDDALACARKGKALFADETKFWEAEARILTVQEKIPEALDVMREAIKKWPNDMNMLFLMGNILDESGDKKAALKLMEQIIEHEPDNFQALNYVGYTLADGNRELERAVALLERAIQLAPDRPYIIDSLAWAYYRVGRKADALREIRRAVKLPASIDPAIWEHYGDIAQSLSLKQEAKDAYVKALELKPENAEALKKKISNL